MEENKKFFAELEIVRFEDTEVITASCGMEMCTYDCYCDGDMGCPCEDDCVSECECENEV